MTAPDAVTATGGRATLDVEFALAPAALLVQQRARLAARLAGLDAAGWRGPTRCHLWDVADLVLHLTDATGWALAALAAGSEADRPEALRGFHPATTPHEHVLAGRGRPPAALLARLREGTQDLATALRAAGAGAPYVPWVGNHTYAPKLVGLHVLWDSWLHERDLGPAASPQAPDPAEFDAVAAYGIFLAGVLARMRLAPGEERVVRLELGELPYRLQVGETVRVSRAARDDAPAPLLRGPALDLLEALAGRGRLADAAEGDADTVELLGTLAARMATADGVRAG